jgi:predicted CXXCH cytochrome family protein
MKKNVVRGFGIIALLLLSTSLGLSADPDGLRILLPQQKTYVNGAVAHLVMAVNPAKIDNVSYTINKKKPVVVEMSREKRKILPDGTIYLCIMITLDAGENKIAIQGYRQGSRVEDKIYQVYSVAKYSLDKNAAPAGYPHYIFHTAQNEGLCIGCHAELGPAKEETMTTVLAESPCYRCHAYVVAGEIKHGPAAVGDCTTCHSEAGAEKYAVVKPIKKLCSICHEDAIQNWEAKKFIHGPTATGDCTICHTPHSSNEKFFLQKKTNDLCIGCHEEKASGRHVVAGFSGKSHPVSGKTNPMKPDRSFSCASCHSPHAANNKQIFTVDVPGGRFSLCQVCHKK